MLTAHGRQCGAGKSIAAGQSWQLPSLGLIQLELGRWLDTA